MQLRANVLLYVLLAISLVACGHDLSVPVADTPELVFKVDEDQDGFSPPEDCLDSGYAWMVTEPHCSETEPIGFVPADGANAKDFAIVERNGAYHVIHIRGFGSWTQPGNEIDFGHASSADLLTWTTHPNIDLLGAPGEWNDKNMWAPQIRRFGSFYIMFYTGVTYDTDVAQNVQRIGRAWSHDLLNWNRTSNRCDGVTGDDCVMDCDAPWSNWGSGEPWSGNCRDPFVILHDGQYVMFVSTSLINGKQVIGRALSNNSRDWTLVDYLPVTEAGVAESPSILIQGDTTYLFWTKNTGVHWAFAPDPMGTFTYGGLMTVGFASETVPLIEGDGIMFPYVDDFEIVFTRLLWDGLVPSLSNVVAPVCLLPSSNIHPQEIDPRNGVDDNCDGFVDSVGPPREARGSIKRSLELVPLGDRFP